MYSSLNFRLGETLDLLRDTCAVSRATKSGRGEHVGALAMSKANSYAIPILRGNGCLGSLFVCSRSTPGKIALTY